MGLSVHTPPAWASCHPAHSCPTWGGSTNPACARRLSSSPAALWHPARTGCAQPRSCPAWTLSPGNDRDGFLAVRSLEANISAETATVIPEAAQQRFKSSLTRYMTQFPEICSLTRSKDKTIALHCPKQMDLWASWVSFYPVEFLPKVNWQPIHSWCNSQSSLAVTYYIWFNWYHIFLQTHTVDRALKIAVWYFCNSSRLHV